MENGKPGWAEDTLRLHDAKVKANETIRKKKDELLSKLDAIKRR